MLLPRESVGGVRESVKCKMDAFPRFDNYILNGLAFTGTEYILSFISFGFEKCIFEFIYDMAEI